MLPYRDSKITKVALLIFFLLVLAYGYFEAQGFLFGPSISIPSGVTEVHQPYISIKGNAQRISSLAMNGKQIAVTEDGSFNEPYLLAPGDNRIVLDATDKYGRTRRQVIEVVYTPGTTTPVQTGAATTTQSASTSPMAQ